MKEKISEIVRKSNNRFDFCTNLIEAFNLANVAELGVYRGEFARKVLETNQCIEKYTMIDPWRSLEAWNKPANTDDETFEKFYQETIEKTNFAAGKRIILRGKTTEVVSKIRDNTLDLVYIDGDHTLKGISVDLISMWPKVKENGFIVGDDFYPSIWQHSRKFEPTLVFPFAVYFAEAVNSRIYALPYGQFVICKQGESEFEFTDLTDGTYNNLELRNQLIVRENSLERMLKRVFPTDLISVINTSAFLPKQKPD
ncbi:MAG: class I SAM-dependent methyltransferase [Bacteroidota bacterium]